MKREQRKTSKEFKEKMSEGFIKGVYIMEKGRLVITTGDVISPDIWTEEKLQELDEVLNKIRRDRIKQQSYDKLISDIENKKIGYGSISSLMLTDKQLNYLRAKYIVAKTNKFGGSSGVLYLVCKG